MSERTPDRQKADNGGPEDELELYGEAADPQTEDPTLEAADLGMGYYENGEYRQQLESFRHVVFAEAAFGGVIEDMERQAVIAHLGTEGWTYIDDDGTRHEFSGWADHERPGRDRRRYIRERGADIWEQLPDRQRKRAVEEVTNDGEDWTPPHERMMKARSVASRGKGARLLDNLFGRVRKKIEELSDRDDGGLFG